MTYIVEERIQSFTKLDAWKQAHVLVLDIYKTLQTFPNDERFALADQIKRCAVSISSNIAEGFSRQTAKEKMQFNYIAKGSLTELQNQLIIARDLGYITTAQFSALAEQTIRVGKLITGLIKYLKDK